MKSDAATNDNNPKKRVYFSTRTGRRPEQPGFTLAQFKRLFLDAYWRLENEGVFREWFGLRGDEYHYTAGRAGGDVSLFVYRKLRKDNLWPIEKNLARYAEDDLFDIVELLHDHSSKAVDSGFGADPEEEQAYDAKLGRARFREVMNDILFELGDGFEVSKDGEILLLGAKPMRLLLSAPLPLIDPENVEARVEEAKRKYLRRGSTESDRRDAVRELFDVLEFLRPKAKLVLNAEDEKDLFNLANNFAIRHHRAGQKTSYDKGIWHSWMFYHCLVTIHACGRLIKKAESAG